MKPLYLNFTVHTPSANEVCLAQQAVGAASLLLNGAAVVGGVAAFARTFPTPQPLKVGYKIDLTSVGNLSGRTYTITGTDENGNALVEAIAGPNANTVTTTGYFQTITGITVDGAFATDITIGTNAAGQFRSQLIPVGNYSPQTTIQVHIGTAAADLKLEKAYEKVTQGDTPTWYAVQASFITDTNWTLNESIGALRLSSNSFAAGAIIAWQITQPRYQR